MKRDIINYLKKWKDSKRRKPLIMTGVRQCGKTYALKEFGSRYTDKSPQESENLRAFFMEY